MLHQSLPKTGRIISKITNPGQSLLGRPEGNDMDVPLSPWGTRRQPKG
jgi:hypothetical protein